MNIDLTSSRILVMGDVMLDRYWWGTVSRISPEAPVPVVALDKESLVTGGAGNVAANVAALGSQPYLVGIVGDDAEAAMLTQVLERLAPADLRIFQVAGRRTTLKTRIVAHNQQIARLDQESLDEIDHETAVSIAAEVEKLLKDIDVIVLSDYGKGFLTRELINLVIKSAAAAGKMVLVDPKGKDYTKYAGATLLTPNQRETAEACGIEPHDLNLLDIARERLLDRLALDALLITQSEAGMSLLESGGGLHRLDASARNVYDVTGAGDTAIAALAVGIGSGMELLDAARIANLAAGISVERVGTTTVNRDELLDAAADLD